MDLMIPVEQETMVPGQRHAFYVSKSGIRSVRLINQHWARAWRKFTDEGAAAFAEYCQVHNLPTENEEYQVELRMDDRLIRCSIEVAWLRELLSR
ncbi:MAG: hypothetical protein OXD46_13055 [Chloroflexi bacterium]|nr:hypothetical protein [Chloroflexota bacterium]